MERLRAVSRDMMVVAGERAIGDAIWRDASPHANPPAQDIEGEPTNGPIPFIGEKTGSKCE